MASLGRRITELESLVATLKARITELQSHAAASKQHIAELQSHVEALRETLVHLQRDTQHAVTQATLMGDRATAAEEMVGKMREHARTLWEAVYIGKIAEPYDILREVERIIHS